ncbi:hypothetical protein [Kaistella sp.]|uniref:hypothetical protein n=1 Tax=Kaistella sp. TaxID=2782235 RepID=UPI0035A037E3
MRTFTEKQIEEYINYTDENVISKEEVLGQCFMCGRPLKEVDLPEGPERKVVCLKDRDFFVEQYEELLDMGEIQ